MKFSRELLLDAHQGTVLLDVSALVGKERERQTERVGGYWVSAALQAWQKIPSQAQSAFLSLQTKQTVNQEPLFASSEGRAFDAISLNVSEQTDI